MSPAEKIKEVAIDAKDEFISWKTLKLLLIVGTAVASIVWSLDSRFSEMTATHTKNMVTINNHFAAQDTAMVKMEGQISLLKQSADSGFTLVATKQDALEQRVQQIEESLRHKGDSP